MKKNRLVRKWKNDLIYSAARGVMALAAKIPLDAGLKIGAALGRAAFFILRSDRAKSLHHLKVAFPDSSEDWRRKVGAESFANLGRSFFELFHFDEIFSNCGRFKDYIRMDGWENFQNAMDRGVGGIFVTAHIGNFELMAAYASRLGYHVNPVVRALYDPRIDQLLNDHRRKYGYAPIMRGEDGGVEVILNHLRSNKFFGILMDQDTKVRGAYVPFLGPPAHTPTGPAYLAYAIGMDVMTGVVHRQPDGRHIITIGAPIPRPQTGNNRADIIEYTRMLNDFISNEIQTHPTEWVWMHRRWKKRPPGEPPHWNPDKRLPPSRPLASLTLRIGALLVEILPVKTATNLARCGGRVARLLMMPVRKEGWKNLRCALDDRASWTKLRKIHRESWAQFGESARMHLLQSALSAPREEVEMDGFEHLEDAAGKPGAVILAARTAFLDPGLWALARKGIPLALVDRGLADPYFRHRLIRSREKNGIAIWPPETGREDLQRGLASGQSVVFPFDPKTREEGGVHVAFFGKTVAVDAAAARLAQATSARFLILYALKSETGRIRVTIRPAPEAAGDAERMSAALSAFEEIILRNPESWIWSHIRLG